MDMAARVRGGSRHCRALPPRRAKPARMPACPATEKGAAEAAPERPAAELEEAARKMIVASMELAEKVEAA